MGDHFIVEILLKYARQENLDEKEHALLEKWQARWGEGRPLDDLIHDREWLRVCLFWQHDPPRRSDWRAQKRLIAATRDPLPAARSDRRWATGIVAVTALILVAAALYIVPASWPARRAALGDAITRDTSLDQAPGGHAQLICNDGRRILPDSIPDNAIIVVEGNFVVRKLAGHILQYELVPDKPVTPMVHFFKTGATGPYKLLFPDGSKVLLKKGASLRYSPALRGTGQPAVLSGEAWFSIAQNSAAPLSVMASGTAVIVLGTEFHVSSAAGKGLTEVCVYRGAVRVQQGAQGVTLRDSDEVAVQNDILLRKKKISDFDSLLAGTDIDQRFHFDNCSLTEAVQQIAGHYHLDVANPTHIQGIPITGSPPKSMPLKTLLNAIGLVETGRAWLSLNGKTILISPAPQ